MIHNPLCLLFCGSPIHLDVVWSESRQSSLIDSLFKGFCVPPLIFCASKTIHLSPAAFWLSRRIAVKHAQNRAPIRTCIDGKQRLTSLFRYVAMHNFSALLFTCSYAVSLEEWCVHLLSSTQFRCLILHLARSLVCVCDRSLPKLKSTPFDSRSPWLVRVISFIPPIATNNACRHTTHKFFYTGGGDRACLSAEAREYFDQLTVTCYEYDNVTIEQEREIFHVRFQRFTALYELINE